MAELAKRLHVTIPSVSTLELNDARGSAKVETLERAHAAMGLAQLVVTSPIEKLREIEAEAREIASDVEWTMALEAQNLPARTTETMVHQLMVKHIAQVICADVRRVHDPEPQYGLTESSYEIRHGPT
jgi:transcriptional regulator with XRE-family HTH domain